MPAPLLMPVMVRVLPPISSLREQAFGWVSVVMIASAALPQLSGEVGHRSGRPATMRSTGSGSRITPVENGSTWLDLMPSLAATASHTARASSRPFSPVPALALPVLITSARIPCPAAR